ncbi:MAG: plasmid mobilization protein [Pseudonocardiaceae bacterium]
MRKMLPVRFEDSEIEEIRAQAAAEGRSLQDYVHDVLMQAIATRTRRRREVLDHVLRVSAALNERLAQ